MKKTMIIGCGGAGKSTLSNQLHQLSGVELIHLDQFFWEPGWVEVSKDKWVEVNKTILQKEQWIIDGNYGSTMDMRLAVADTIVFLDTPTLLRLYRIIKRWWQYRGQSRPDMTVDCPERISFEFLHYILLYNKTRRPSILRKLQKNRQTKNVYILRNQQDRQLFLRAYKAAHSNVENSGD